MKKLLFVFAVSAVGIIFTMPNAAKAQKITEDPLYYVSVKVQHFPLITSTGPVTPPKKVMNTSNNYDELRKASNSGGEYWNGYLKHWPRKKSYYREM